LREHYLLLGTPTRAKALSSVTCSGMFGSMGTAISQPHRELARNVPDIEPEGAYLRITSPHEAGESLEEFLDKTDDKITRNLHYGRRWNFAGPLQPGRRKTCRAAPILLTRSSNGSHPSGYELFS